jgi:hypothetical protein
MLFLCATIDKTLPYDIDTFAPHYLPPRYWTRPHQKVGISYPQTGVIPH